MKGEGNQGHASASIYTEGILFVPVGGATKDPELGVVQSKDRLKANSPIHAL